MRNPISIKRRKSPPRAAAVPQRPTLKKRPGVCFVNSKVWKKNGGPSRSLYQKLFPPGKIVDSLSVPLFPPYKNKDLLHQKYVVEGLSIAQIAGQLRSSKSAIRGNLKRFSIPIREPHRNHGSRTERTPRTAGKETLKLMESTKGLRNQN